MTTKIVKEGELDEASVIRKLRTTAKDSKTYKVLHYNFASASDAPAASIRHLIPPAKNGRKGMARVTHGPPDQTDLFTYPHRPGHKRTDTSKTAADDMAPKAGTLRTATLDRLRRSTGLTADEVALALDVDRLSIRPRLSELREMGLVEDSGRRAPNASGKTAIVWRAVR
tara:strand:+ start:32079 stop:32588 length:510 start_codon:yes stop_codon:yes gene_type:complete